MEWCFGCYTCMQRRRCQTPKACGKFIPLASTQSFATPWINSVPVHTQHYQDTHQSVSGAAHQMSSSTCNKIQNEAWSGWPQFWDKTEAERLVCTSTAYVEPGLELIGSGWWGGGHGHHRDLRSRCSILHWGWLLLLLYSQHPAHIFQISSTLSGLLEICQQIHKLFRDRRKQERADSQEDPTTSHIYLEDGICHADYPRGSVHPPSLLKSRGCHLEAVSPGNAELVWHWRAFLWGLSCELGCHGSCRRRGHKQDIVSSNTVPPNRHLKLKCFLVFCSYMLG